MYGDELEFLKKQLIILIEEDKYALAEYLLKSSFINNNALQRIRLGVEKLSEQSNLEFGDGLNVIRSEFIINKLALCQLINQEQLETKIQKSDGENDSIKKFEILENSFYFLDIAEVLLKNYRKDRELRILEIYAESEVTSRKFIVFFIHDLLENKLLLRRRKDSNTYFILSKLGKGIIENIIGDKTVSIKVSISKDFKKYTFQDLSNLFYDLKNSIDKPESINISNLSQEKLVLTLTLDRSYFNRFITWFDDDKIRKYEISNVSFFSESAGMSSYKKVKNGFSKFEKEKIALKEAVGESLFAGLKQLKEKISPMSERFNEIIHLYSRFKQLKDNKRLGLVPIDQMNEESRIVISTLSLIDDIMEEDFELIDL